MSATGPSDAVRSRIAIAENTGRNFVFVLEGSEGANTVRQVEVRVSDGPNTRKRLSFHTDRCDVIGFLCLRQARSGARTMW